ncbi:MAG: hypothetical protein AVDCRST_MAG52-3531, partial [uncultured Blastococcus sp.]
VSARLPARRDLRSRGYAGIHDHEIADLVRRDRRPPDEGAEPSCL